MSIGFQKTLKNKTKKAKKPKTLESCNTTTFQHKKCKILTFDRAINRETGASGRRYRNITLTSGRVEFGADAKPTGSRWMSNNYITRCHRRFELVGVRDKQTVSSVKGSCCWSSRQAWFSSSCSHSSSSSFTCEQDAVMRASARQRTFVLRTPVEQSSRMRKTCCYGQRNLGSKCGSLSSSQTHLSHVTDINPFATLS